MNDRNGNVLMVGDLVVLDNPSFMDWVPRKNCVAVVQELDVKNVLGSGGHVLVEVDGKSMVFLPKVMRLEDKRNRRHFAAACGRCGGWTSRGGMSQHSDGPSGCDC